MKNLQCKNKSEKFNKHKKKTRKNDSHKTQN